jgi:hypothetical protein
MILKRERISVFSSRFLQKDADHEDSRRKNRSI